MTSLGCTRFRRILGVLAAFSAFGFVPRSSANAQGLSFAWSSYGHDAQHSAISANASQPLTRIIWSTPVDENPQFSGSALLIHYGSPLITQANTLVLPVKTGLTGGFRFEGRNAATGALIWSTATDYTLPPHDWIPSCSGCITPRNRLYFPGAGGTLYYRDNPDAAGSTTGQIAFYGIANYNADKATYDANVRINTPITVDRYGDIFFGFQVLGATPLGLQSGIARISYNDAGSWVSASAAASDGAIAKVAHNCAPALSVDHRTLYFAVNSGGGGGAGFGYLLAANAVTLATTGKVRLKDVKNTASDALVHDDGTASPTVGPDGDVYLGILENPFGYNHLRGWLLHFNSTLTVSKTPGAFGWDDTASIVPKSMVPSYSGTSSYLLLTKYNNYVEGGGDGVNKMAVVDPNSTMVDPISGATVMKEILTIAGPTADPSPGHPNAVREWCINTAAVDPATKSILVNCEDGKLYRWDMTTGLLSETIVLNVATGEAYTPTVIAKDGTVFAINRAVLYGIGR
jgi:hypothetical protein